MAKRAVSEAAAMTAAADADGGNRTDDGIDLTRSRTRFRRIIMQGHGGLVESRVQK